MVSTPPKSRSIKFGRAPSINNGKWNHCLSEKYAVYRPEVNFFGNGEYIGFITYSDIIGKYVAVIINAKTVEPSNIFQNADKDKLKEYLIEAIEATKTAHKQSDNG